MNDLNNLGKMHYIMDNSGNYYRVNSKDQLVTAGSREEAGVFTFLEANQRIGDGKKARFYTAIPVNEEEEEKVTEIKSIVPAIKQQELKRTEEQEFYYEAEKPKESKKKKSQNSNPEMSYDIHKIDWEEYLIHFCYIASGIKNYQEELNQLLSDIDMQICDVLHYIELYDLEEEESLSIMSLLKDCRERRRDIKDEMLRTDCFQKAIGTSSNIAKAKEGAKQLGKLSKRKYQPRKLQVLFQNTPKKTERKKRIFSEEIEEEIEEIEEVIDTIDSMENEPDEIAQEEIEMEYTRQETTFDHQENNWKQFAQQQVEFYGNAKQYMYNLQVDLDEIETKIENTLNLIEDANYNVAQGYKVFKQLKDLRNERKEKIKELECLEVMVNCFDCEAMRDAYQYSLDAIEDIMEESEKSVQVVETTVQTLEVPISEKEKSDSSLESVISTEETPISESEMADLAG